MIENSSAPAASPPRGVRVLTGRNRSAGSPPTRRPRRSKGIIGTERAKRCCNHLAECSDAKGLRVEHYELFSCESDELLYAYNEVL